MLSRLEEVFILEIASEKLVEAEIVPAKLGELPIQEAGWNFDWRKLFEEKNAEIFVLKIKGKSQSVEGIVLLKIENSMLIMDLVEIAPHNRGRKNKQFDYVAGCLIAFACRESFNIEGNYKGFLTFVSKTKLIKWYQAQYGAKQALGQRMYIDDIAGLKLIEEYLKRKR